MNLCLELVADKCSCISGLHAVLWCSDVVLVYNCVSTAMSRIVNLDFLDLMEAYHCVTV